MSDETATAYAVMVSYCRHGIFSRIFLVSGVTMLAEADLHGIHSLGGEPPHLANSAIGNWEHRGMLERYCPDSFSGHVVVTWPGRLSTYLEGIYAAWSEVATDFPASAAWRKAIVDGLVEETAATMRINKWAPPGQ